MARKDELTDILFHLGKGVWKSVPILGPVIEEVFYERLRDDLAGQISRLDVDQVGKLATAVSNLTPEFLEETSSRIISAILEAHTENSNRVISSLAEHRHHLDTQVGALQDGLAPLTNLRSLLADIRSKLGNEAAIRDALDELSRKRRQWIQRISLNQRRLLSQVPTEHVSLDSLWKMARTVIPDCMYKELRFRLHELEWLGLVERYWHTDHKTWVYRRIREVDEEPIAHGNW